MPVLCVFALWSFAHCIAEWTRYFQTFHLGPSTWAIPFNLALRIIRSDLPLRSYACIMILTLRPNGTGRDDLSCFDPVDPLAVLGVQSHYFDMEFASDGNRGRGP